MSDTLILELIEIGSLIVQVDAGRVAGDPFKLTTEQIDLLQTRLTDAKARNAAVAMIGGSTVGASVQRQQALDRLADLVRYGYKTIDAVQPEDLSDAERAQCFAAYGWEQGNIGQLTTTSRIEQLARQTAMATADATVPAAGKYPADLVSRIAQWLGVADGAQLLANGGTRQTLIQRRNDARELLRLIIARIRHQYCAASDALDQTPELARIGMQPRRDRGEAQPAPHPDAPSAASFDAVSRTLSVATMPAHTTFLRAYRQPAGGQPETAGVSNTPQISVVGSAPLTPGVAYEFWVVGVNSRGEGPASNHVAFLA